MLHFVEHWSDGQVDHLTFGLEIPSLQTVHAFEEHQHVESGNVRDCELAQMRADVMICWGVPANSEYLLRAPVLRQQIAALNVSPACRCCPDAYKDLDHPTSQESELLSNMNRLKPGPIFEADGDRVQPRWMADRAGLEAQVGVAGEAECVVWSGPRSHAETGAMVEQGGFAPARGQAARCGGRRQDSEVDFGTRFCFAAWGG